MLETHGVVIRNDPLGAGGYSMQIEAPDLATIALPGQFVMLKCSDGLDPLMARPFSIADVVEDRIGLVYLVVGRGTGLMAKMESGQRVPLLGPLGKPFTFREPADHYVMIAGGIGSAPFSLLARVLAEVDPGAERILLLGGRTKEHLYERERLEELCTTVSIATDDGSEGHHGLVTELLPPHLAKERTRLYACGPTVMFKTIRGMLDGCDHPCEISVEPIMACGFGACCGCVVPRREGEGFVYVKSCEEGPTFEIRDLVMDLMPSH